MKKFDEIIKNRLSEVKTPEVGLAWAEFSKLPAKSVVNWKIILFRYKIWLSVLLLLGVSTVIYSWSKDPRQKLERTSIFIPINKPHFIPISTTTPLYKQSHLLVASSVIKKNVIAVGLPKPFDNFTKKDKKPFINIACNAIVLNSFPLQIKENKIWDNENGACSISPKIFFSRKTNVELSSSIGLIPLTLSSKSGKQLGLELMVSRSLSNSSAIALGFGIQTLNIRPLSVEQLNHGVRDSLTHYQVRHIIIPLEYRYKVSQMLTFNIGPQVGFINQTKAVYHLKNSKQIEVGQQSIERTNAFQGIKIIDLSMRAGIDINANRFSFGLRYQQGITDYTKNLSLKTNTYNTLSSLLLTFKVRLFKE